MQVLSQYRAAAFSEMSKSVGLDDPHGYAGLGAVGTDLGDPRSSQDSPACRCGRNSGTTYPAKFHIAEEGTRIVSRQGALGKPLGTNGTEIRSVQ